MCSFRWAHFQRAAVWTNSLWRLKASPHSWVAFSKKLIRVVFCLWSRNRKRRWCQIFFFQQSKKIIFRADLGVCSTQESQKLYLGKIFSQKCRRCKEDIVTTVASTVATRFLSGYGQSCFCLHVVIGGDNDFSGFRFFQIFLDSFCWGLKLWRLNSLPLTVTSNKISIVPG